MKTFKDYITMNEAKDNFLTPTEIKKLKAHYDGNPGLRSISQSIKDFESDHEAFVKLKGNVDKSVKDNMIKTSTRLRKLGIEDGVLNEDSDVEDKDSLDEVELDESDINVNARTYNLHKMDVTSLKNSFIVNSGLSGMTSKISKIISQKPIAAGWEFALQMENGNKETVRMKVLTVEISQV